MSDLNEMNEMNNKCFDTFPGWLRSLGEDVEALLAAAEVEDLDHDVRLQLTGGINYIFKSLDLIPDSIDEIGYLDDAFVLRVTASLVPDDQMMSTGEDNAKALTALAEQTKLIREFLGEETYKRLQGYTADLKQSSARGRSVKEIVSESAMGREFASEIRGFSKSYECPVFSKDEKNLFKLHAFFDAKLPR